MNDTLEITLDDAKLLHTLVTAHLRRLMMASLVGQFRKQDYDSACVAFEPIRSRLTAFIDAHTPPKKGIDL